MSKYEFYIESPSSFEELATLKAYVGVYPAGHAYLIRDKNIARLEDIVIENYETWRFDWFPYPKRKHHYRGKGYGSLLLKEIIKFSSVHNICQIEGKAEGDLKFLVPWYKRHGFEVDKGNNIRHYLNK
jgi:GNAT superfamily N-acetyltransferase